MSNTSLWFRLLRLIQFQLLTNPASASNTTAVTEARKQLRACKGDNHNSRFLTTPSLNSHHDIRHQSDYHTGEVQRHARFTVNL